MTHTVDEPLAREIWSTRYRFVPPGGTAETDIGESWDRVSRTLASAENTEKTAWQQRFRQALEEYRFLPGGRILAGAGTGYETTLFNCFVMGVIEDSLEGIFRALEEGALTMQQGGGVGYDFSTLRPRGSPARRTGGIASGPVSFMHIWDAMCVTVTSSGFRRGAMMATLRCDHPDILAFVAAKSAGGGLQRFNLSVQVTDDFLRAVRADKPWPLVFPLAAGETAAESVKRRWTGTGEPVPCAVHARLPARELWDRLINAAWECGDPGLLFVDRINRENNLHYRESITASNPCGEIPLPPYGACDLGSINLPAFIHAPFTGHARLDVEGIRHTVNAALRMLDNAVDISRYPLSAQAEQARGARRLGLGITGLGDALIMLGLHYGQERAREWAAGVMRDITHTAYRSSVELAREKGAFSFLDRDRYLRGAFIRRLPEDIRRGIREHGIRNSHLLAIAPAGSISLLAGNISSGIEPLYALRQRRRITTQDGSVETRDLEDYAFRLWRRIGGDEGSVPGYFVTAAELDPEAHMAMQAALQPFVDNAISKTINVAADCSPDQFARLCEDADRLGLKGVTLYRPTGRTPAVLESHPATLSGAPATAGCCAFELKQLPRG